MNIHKHIEAIFVVALDNLSEVDATRLASVARDAATADARAVVVRAPTLPQRA